MTDAHGPKILAAGHDQPPPEVEAEDLRTLLASGDENLVLIDCRLAEERRLTAIEPSEFVPLGAFDSEFEARLRPLLGRTILVYCRSGMRSLEFVHRLHARGFTDARSLAGGINRYNTLFDAGPTY